MRNANRVSVLTGAGISAESGIATFRGKDGIWKKFKPEELASVDAFLNNPEMVWEWYNYRRKIIEQVQPNAGHFVLAEMEKHFTYFSICTQNVDGLHQKAGSQNVFELHGNITKNKCQKCNRPMEQISFDIELPRCQCGGLIRPDVVWFGEFLPEDVWESCQFNATTSDVFLTIGTSSVVYPAADLPIQAQRYGAMVIEINPEPTPFSNSADFSLRGNAGEVLPKLWQAIQG